MPELTVEQLNEFINEIVDTFHKNRLKKIQEITLSHTLRHKNPYLLKCKNLNRPDLFVGNTLNSITMSGEETSFGKLLESLAIFICEQKYSGRKSSTPGLDLEFERNAIRYLVSIKSGPFWGNDDQIKKMQENFNSAISRIRQTDRRSQIECVCGCCYGRQDQNKEQKVGFVKKCGQSFWEFLTEDDTFYKRIIEPMGLRAREKDEIFQREFDRVYTRLLTEFIAHFCVDNEINWNKVLEFNSGKIRLSLPRRRRVHRTES